MKTQNLSSRLMRATSLLMLLCITTSLQTTNYPNGGNLYSENNGTVADTQKKSERVEIIAHRGFWTGTSQNSRESLRKAQALGVYGSETDVWLTTDGHIFVNHDPSYNGVVIKESTSEDCKNLVLKNGEHMPELKDFLEIIKLSESPTKLIIEIKDHDKKDLNCAAAIAVVQAVRDYGVEDKVEYISFSDDVCDQIIKEDPTAKVSKVASLSGCITPEELHRRGITGLDYHFDVFKANPSWVDEAHKLGLTVNVWTVSTAEKIVEMINLGVDFITTDTPDEALKLR